jgi:trans-2,3-dihydro-3-hydroxyanthranilate isomerase
MARHEYRLVDVFTSERFGGNPLAVFPAGDQVPEASMQRIARELNLSETTFVTRSTRPGCDVRVRIFTPRRELPMAGHPTVGTAWVLGRGDRMVFEEGVGPVPVVPETLPSGGVRWWMAQPPPTFTPVAEERAAVAAGLGLTAAELAPDLPVEIGSSAVPFVLIPLVSLEALEQARVEAAAWARLASLRSVTEIYPFVITAPGAVRARMFAPALGIVEDPATGAACGPLGGYLARHGRLPAARPARIVCGQGYEMGRPSDIHIAVAGPGEPVRVGGECVAVGGGWIEL